MPPPPALPSAHSFARDHVVRVKLIKFLHSLGFDVADCRWALDKINDIYMGGWPEAYGLLCAEAILKVTPADQRYRAYLIYARRFGAALRKYLHNVES